MAEMRGGYRGGGQEVIIDEMAEMRGRGGGGGRGRRWGEEVVMEEY